MTGFPLAGMIVLGLAVIVLGLALVRFAGVRRPDSRRTKEELHADSVSRH
ncbi:MAG: hypothetical protein ACR2KK_13580 [Acidimicrobiales bacterium]